MGRALYFVVPWGAEKWAVHSGNAKMRTQFTSSMEAIEFAASLASTNRIVHGCPTRVRILGSDGSLVDEWEFGKEDLSKADQALMVRHPKQARKPEPAGRPHPVAPKRTW
ncbi:MAG: hypothetical protein EON58_19620 [Alphaproteobacteria bacterium]|nr:MAG: hypothetical protein EON58_19620 [Alphaproteobacteria bacterium]